MATLSDMKPSFLELLPEEKLSLIQEIRILRRKRVEKKVKEPKKTKVSTARKSRKPKYDISQISDEVLLEAARQRGLR